VKNGPNDAGNTVRPLVVSVLFLLCLIITNQCFGTYTACNLRMRGVEGDDDGNGPGEFFCCFFFVSHFINANYYI